MPNLKIAITAVAPAGPGKGTGTYDKLSGPGQVTSDGEISLVGVGKADHNLVFAITAAGYKFANPGFSAVMESPFGVPSNNTTPPDPPAADTVCTIPDDASQAAYKYTLHLIDSSNASVDLDPKIINR